ncbi:hypothetical protein MPSEU_000299400 [Mayamaea pseudoterrestris]|nr:hypothetical protein MPSEU_000299400 [Mayamaea pseudoterrestris]
MSIATLRLLQQHKELIRRAVNEVQRDVFGRAPQLNMRTGIQRSKQQLQGVYMNQYYMDPIATSARKFIPGFETELEERKRTKLEYMKRRGKGPPKKGSGARKKK